MTISYIQAQPDLIADIRFGQGHILLARVIGYGVSDGAARPIGFGEGGNGPVGTLVLDPDDETRVITLASLINRFKATIAEKFAERYSDELVTVRLRTVKG